MANAQWVIRSLNLKIYTSALIPFSTICVHSATRQNIHMTLCIDVKQKQAHFLCRYWAAVTGTVKAGVHEADIGSFLLFCENSMPE